jgi:NADH dehydrogenase
MARVVMFGDGVGLPAMRILILGGGFGAMAAARKLERILRPDEAELTVVSRENFSVFTPMLPEVPSGNLEPRHVVTPIRAQLRRATFVLGEVVGVDFDERIVDVRHAIDGTQYLLAYEHVVFALGSATSTFNLPGVAEHSLALKDLEDAERIRNHALACFELADVTDDGEKRKKLLTFAIVGGGFTGVEAAGEFTDFFRSIARFYRAIDPREISIVLVEAGPRLLPDLASAMGAYSAHALERRGVRVLLNAPVAGADEDGLTLKDGTRVATATIIWSAGVKPSPLVASLPIGTGRGGAIVVRHDLSVAGYPGVWAIGDCAQVPAPDGRWYPPTAQHAIREGPVVARNIANAIRGLPTEPFRYEALGMMASLGGRRGVAGLRGGRVLTGFLAWFLWRTYYLLRLPGIDRQVRVALDWTLGLIFPRDISELRLYTESRRDERIAGPDSVSKPGPPR